MSLPEDFARAAFSEGATMVVSVVATQDKVTVSLTPDSGITVHKECQMRDVFSVLERIFRV